MRHSPGTTHLQLGAIRGTIVEGKLVWGDAPGGLCFPYISGSKRTGTEFVASYMGFNGSHVITAESTAADCATIAMNDTLGVSDSTPEPSRGLKLKAGALVPFRL